MGRISARVDDELNTVLDGLEESKSTLVRNGVKRELAHLLGEQDMSTAELASELDRDEEAIEDLLYELDIPEYIPDDNDTEPADAPAELDPEISDDPIPNFRRGDMTPQEVEQLLEDIGVQARVVGPLGIPIPRANVEYLPEA